MQVIRSISDLDKIPGPVVLAVGVFDGIHLGHQAVIGEALDLADEIGGAMTLATFEPHPARVLRPENAPLVLTSLPHKEKLLARLGVGYLLVIPFTPELAVEDPVRFTLGLVAAARPLGGIVTGSDFCFGRERGGNPALLARLGAEHGFRVRAVDAVLVDGERVSSTRLRRAVQAGDFALCHRLLGREHTVLGTVVEGRRLGRTLGFPTANLSVHSEQLPPHGVYAVEAWIDGHHLGGVANLGLRPTIETEGSLRKVLEVHLFDFHEDIYGHDMEVRFVRFLRDEQTFSGIDELRAAIEADARTARKVLA